ncbi:selenoprotein K-like isoform X2 [Aricia agestis]|uniref:selenoprotein K-like isoform X2 n=1 Tax=Aricia agestis TaxID=91739 RepID=UPI001C205732|nr:selenoprotein K-like isoform X2 [Aricia agestis]
MVYINKDGAVVERNPFNIFGWFWGAINFIYLFFQTLISPSYSKHGDKYVQDFRPPGSGPPKPPSKKFGGFGPSSSGPSPPPMGGGGCGCG